MSLFLGRSKSTRELKSKLGHPPHELPNSINPTGLPKTTTIFGADPHQNSLGKLRKRSGTALEKPISPTIGASVQQPRMDRFMKLRKQQSMDSVRMQATSTAYMSQSASASTRSASIPTTVGTKGIFPERTSSRLGYHSHTKSPGIGIAIGSPTQGHVQRNLPILRSPNTGTDKSDSPVFLLPPEPFVVEGGERKANINTVTTTPAKDWQEWKGWKKLFGRSFFGTKKWKKNVTLPESQPVSQPVLQPITFAVKSQSDNQESNGSTHTSSHINAQIQSVEVPRTPETEFSPKTSPRTSPEKTQSSSKENTSPPKLTEFDSLSLLDVSIPSIEMERYSVMFQSLLENDCLGEGKLEQPSMKPTLFERRNSANENGIRQMPRLQLQPLKRSATTAGYSSLSIPPTRFDSNHDATAKSRMAYSRSLKNRSHTYGGDVRKKLSVIASPGHGFVLVGESIPSATLPTHGDPFDSIEIADETSKVPTLRRNSSSASKFTQQDPSIATPRASFDQGDDTWLQKNVGEPENDGTIVARASRSSAGAANIGGTVNDQPLWELLIKQDPNKRASPIPETKLEDDGTVPALPAQISIARQVSISRRQVSDFSVSPSRERKNYEGDGAVKIVRRAQSVKVARPRLVNVRSNQVNGCAKVEYGHIRRLSLEENTSRNSVIVRE